MHGCLKSKHVWDAEAKAFASGLVDGELEWRLEMQRWLGGGSSELRYGSGGLQLRVLYRMPEGAVAASIETRGRWRELACFVSGCVSNRKMIHEGSHSH